MNQIKVAVTFTERLLGSLNNNPDILREFTASKAETPEKEKEEVEAVQNQADTSVSGGVIDPQQPEETEDVEERIEKQTTVFPRLKDGSCHCWDYQWRGFFKEAMWVGIECGETALGHLSKWTVKRAVDSMLFVAERRIPFTDPNGALIKEVTLLERPLRATTARGERICLARSEVLPEDTQAHFTIKWMQAPADSKMCITSEAIKWALDYGALKGFGQWRGGGYGRFGYKILEEILQSPPPARPKQARKVKAA